MDLKLFTAETNYMNIPRKIYVFVIFSSIYYLISLYETKKDH